jgi:hypothetical protein
MIAMILVRKKLKILSLFNQEQEVVKREVTYQKTFEYGREGS